MSTGLRQLGAAVAERAASRYIVGPEVDDAITLCRSLAQQGISTTICGWNPEHIDAPDNAGRCIAAIEAIARADIDCYLSLKALDVGFSTGLLAGIARAGRERQVMLHFDSMAPDAADGTFAVLHGLAEAGVRLGCTIPGRWRRSPEDAEVAAALGWRVRVVKGQWPDPEQPGMDMRAGFARVIEAVAGRTESVAVATHDPDLLRWAVERLRREGTACELELLFGLPSRAAFRVAREIAVPIRVYVPYGHAWLPYAFRQAMKRPKIMWWTLRDVLARRSSDPWELLRL